MGAKPTDLDASDNKIDKDLKKTLKELSADEIDEKYRLLDVYLYSCYTPFFQRSSNNNRKAVTLVVSPPNFMMFMDELS